ncbi:hypothetical protein CMUS01_04411 [Colletotrichum musicola]|uniref:Uncharacterized protein n=1 Tax=Colletotrichum musicola TaxID=2175873 RepID=A0A8H6KWJ8_9PEZI|nr:hypothetical protein CMUS01_04411 [Colletotrichum musicola]
MARIPSIYPSTHILTWWSCNIIQGNLGLLTPTRKHGTDIRGPQLEQRLCRSGYYSGHFKLDEDEAEVNDEDTDEELGEGELDGKVLVDDGPLVVGELDWELLAELEDVTPGVVVDVDDVLAGVTDDEPLELVEVAPEELVVDEGTDVLGALELEELDRIVLELVAEELADVVLVEEEVTDVEL